MDGFYCFGLAGLAALLLASGYYAGRSRGRPVVGLSALGVVLSLLVIAQSIGTSSVNLFVPGLLFYAGAANVLMGALLGRAMIRVPSSIEHSARCVLVFCRFGLLASWAVASAGLVLLLPSILEASPTSLGRSDCTFGMVLMLPLAMLLPSAPVLAIVGGLCAFSGLHGWWEPGNKRGKRNDGRCAKCGYLLHGLPEPRCPECGTPFERPWPHDFNRPA